MNEEQLKLAEEAKKKLKAYIIELFVDDDRLDNEYRVLAVVSAAIEFAASVGVIYGYDRELFISGMTRQIGVWLEEAYEGITELNNKRLEKEKENEKEN